MKALNEVANTLFYVAMTAMGIPFAIAAGAGCGIVCGVLAAVSFAHTCRAEWKARAIASAAGKETGVVRIFPRPPLFTQRQDGGRNVS